jgi:hypothetical protein
VYHRQADANRIIPDRWVLQPTAVKSKPGAANDRGRSERLNDDDGGDGKAAVSLPSCLSWTVEN